MVALGLALLAGVGCQKARVASPRQEVYFGPLATELPRPEVVVDRGPQRELSDDDLLTRTLREFEADSEAILQREDVRGQIGRIQAAYRAQGRELDALATFQRDVARRGADSPAAPNLAWGLMKLGQEVRARQLLDQLLAKRPDEASTWFLYGADAIGRAQSSREAAADAVAAWSRALELDPRLQGFDGVDPLALRQQRAELLRRGRFTDEEIAQARQRLDALASPAPAEGPTEEQPVAPGPAAPAPSPDQEQEQQAVAPSVAAPTSAPRQKQQVPPSPRVLLVRAQLALAEGRADEARRLYGVLRQRGELAEARARLGILQLGWRLGGDQPALRREARTLGQDSALPPAVLYDLALFELRQLQAPDRAHTLLQRLQREDPAFARAQDVAGLLGQIRQ